jgi:o-succinylbenzoate---CoA ligase
MASTGCLLNLSSQPAFDVTSEPHQPHFWTCETCWVAAAPGVRTVGVVDGLRELKLAAVCLFQTSGSEGEPKWVVLAKEALLHSARSVCEHLQVNPKDRWLLTLPTWHVGGFSIWARSWVSGCKVVTAASKWNVHRFAEQCEQEAVTLTSLVPTQVFDLVHAKLRAPAALRAIVVGGGRLEQDLGLRARALGWPVLQSYGMTEAASQVATEPLAHLESRFDPDRMLVLPGWDLAVKESGRLEISGPALASGYVAHGADGWRMQQFGGRLLTRDLAELSCLASSQWLKVLGREANVLKVLGELVHLTPLQTRLRQLADAMGIRHAQLAAAHDERAGEVIILRHEAGQETAAEALRLAFNEQVRPYERAVRLQSAQVTELGKMMA